MMPVARAPHPLIVITPDVVRFSNIAYGVTSIPYRNPHRIATVVKHFKAAVGQGQTAALD